MGRKSEIDIRYQVLNRCFRNRFREYTIDDLVDECNRALREAFDYTYSVSLRTVRADIATLQMPPYSIRLNENLFRGRKRLYRYANPDDSLFHVRMNDTERDQINAAIDVLKKYKGEPLYDWALALLVQTGGGLVKEGAESVVSFQSNPDLEGLKHFSGLLHAILTKRVLKLIYTPYDKQPIRETIYPYHLKQYNDRWYLIARVKGYEQYGRIALDRIDSFEELALPFIEPDFGFSDYFDDYIGVTDPECPPEDIIIKVRKPRFNYIKTKPLHLTQITLEETDTHAVIKINVKVNNELLSLILSFGADMEIISPTSLREQISNRIRELQDIYLKCEKKLHT